MNHYGDTSNVRRRLIRARRESHGGGREQRGSQTTIRSIAGSHQLFILLVQVIAFLSSSDSRGVSAFTFVPRSTPKATYVNSINRMFYHRNHNHGAPLRADTIDSFPTQEEEQQHGLLSFSPKPPITSNDDEGGLKIEQRNLRFGGVGRLYSTSASLEKKVNDSDSEHDKRHLQILDRLSSASVMVVGLGGVGSWAAEALCRSGIGHIVMIDLDDICISNTNRQSHAMSTTLGKMKIDEMEQRLLNINPDCNITLIHDFVNENNIDSIFERLPNTAACLDAIDGATAKSALIAACERIGMPLVSVGGSAGRTDPTKVVCEDLAHATGCPLLRSCKKILRKKYGFEEGKSFRNKSKTHKWGIHAVFSTEEQKRVHQDSSSLRRCDGALGTACFVTGTFGFVAAGKIVEMIASDNVVVPKGSKSNSINL